MAVYQYEARDRTDRRRRGTIAADTPRQARDSLRAQGLRVQAMAPARGAEQARFRWRGGDAARLAAAVRELATLLSVGIPLAEALDTLVKQHRGGFRTALLVVRDRVSAGRSLAESLAEQPHVFDALTVQMVEVGENTGRLEAVLEQLADFKERSLELKDRVLTALLYPSIVFATSLVVTIFLMTVVVPMLLTNLIEAGRTLPWPTRVLKSLSDTILADGWLGALVALVVVAGVVAIVRTPRGRRHWQRLVLRLPLVGPMALKQAIARVALVVSTMIRSGVVYLTAVEIAARTTTNLVVRDALETSSREIAAGVEIGPALEHTRVFPPLVVHIFTVGQQAGRLDDLLERLARDYDRQVATASARLAAAMEPLLILVLAVFVGFILFATLLPILEAGNVL